MAKELTQIISDQVTKQDIKIDYIFRVSGIDYSSYLISWDVSYSKDFGSASATFTLRNPDGVFGSAGESTIEIGNVVELIELFEGDIVEWKKFYGIVDKAPTNKSGTGQTITLSCLDYISSLQFLDIDLELEADKVAITNETLVPQYLPSPNESIAQVFNFANNAIADTPLPVLAIKSKDLSQDDPQFDGFQIYYENGQVKMGSPLNALYNYDVVARSYSFYPVGLYVEDVLEEILKQEDGYGGFLFGETSAQDFIDNHLTETFLNVEGVVGDTLTPNLVDEEIVIRTVLTADFDPDASGSPTTLYVADTSGFPSIGNGTVAGDSFSWTSKDATHLYGITGLLAHPTDSYVKYTATYEIGQVWYLKYSNLVTVLTSSNFTVAGSANIIRYIDRRFGRIILASAADISDVVTCNVDYSFKTLQATGIELNKISFRSRELPNRFEAVKKLKGYLAPNFIIRTQGDDKIWASYLYQKTSPDYNLNLITQANYLGDEDIFTRVKFWGKNKAPTNLMFNDGVQFITTGNSYKSLATQDELAYDREEGNYHIYKPGIPGTGSIDTTSFTPIVYLNSLPINNTLQQIVQAPVQVVVRTRTETTQKGGGACSSPEVETNTYFDYDVYFANSNIDISSDIIIYNDVGQVVYTIAAGNPSGRTGVWTIGGGQQNGTITTFSSASYKVYYSTADLVIDADNAEFKISKSLLPAQVNTVVTATYEYITVMNAVSQINNVIDGRIDTQTQSIFFAEPPTGYEYAILDLGAIYNIQAIDIIPGYFKPDDIRKFDTDMTLTIKSSTDNVVYSDISDKTHAFSLSTGDPKSFEEDDLGINFQARYLLVLIEDLKKIDYQPPTKTTPGVWVISVAEIAAFDDIVISAEATLIPTTILTSDIVLGSFSGSYPTTVNVQTTVGFTQPESAEQHTAYIDGDSFTYTGMTATSFTGVQGLSEAHLIGDRVTKELEGDTTVYDDFGLLKKVGDRLYKNVDISDEKLYDQTLLNRLVRAYLLEFMKNHSRVNIDVLFAPHLMMGQTIALTDPYEGYVAENFFVESLSSKNGYYSIVLARYPA